ncbi:hypothetical protein F2P81_005130 [Scophthalmus maximus]|uniref:Uncharacterized protein n=1 Tax=Scophthalmus maximus TaxID=52904 RepID=A0A6A4TB03_SCOMX|nr:hypothetical protein F2P81_005130 [Scophthalmus maximus]
MELTLLPARRRESCLDVTSGTGSVLKAAPRHVTDLESIMVPCRTLLLYLRSAMWTLLFYCACFQLTEVLTEDVQSCEHLRLGQYPSSR